MFCLEVGKVLLIFGVLGSLFVLGELRIVLFLGGCSLALACFSRVRGKSLPPLAYQLGNLREGKLLPLQSFSHFFESISEMLLRQLRRVLTV